MTIPLVTSEFICTQQCPERKPNYKKRFEDLMRFGVEENWWQEWDKGGPIKVHKIKRLNDPLGISKETKAHVLYNLGYLKSIGEGRRMNLFVPCEDTWYWGKGKRIRIEME